MAEPEQERRDLDPADIDEVRGRIVDPVLAVMFQPGEVTHVQVSPGRVPDSWAAFGESETVPGFSSGVGPEDFIHPIAKAGFWLEDAEWAAGELADQPQWGRPLEWCRTARLHH